MDVRNFNFMFYGFTAAWVIIAAYVFTIAARERKLRRELDRLRRLVEDKEEHARG